MFLADDLEHLQVDCHESNQLSDQTLANSQGLARRERSGRDALVGGVHRRLLSYSGISHQPGRALAL